MENDMLDGCTTLPAKSKMIGDDEKTVVANGKLKVTPTVNGGSDQTAQVLKDIAILNGHMSEPLEDLCGSFASEQDISDKMDTEANGHTGENSMDSGLVENGEAQNGKKGDKQHDPDCESSKDSAKSADHEPMNTDSSEKKDEESCANSDISGKCEEDVESHNNIADISNKCEESVDKLFDKVLNELDSEDDDNVDPHQKNVKSTRTDENSGKNSGKQTPTEKGDESSVANADIDIDNDDSVNKEQNLSNKNNAAGIKIIDLSDSEHHETVTSDIGGQNSAESNQKAEDINKVSQTTDKQSAIINIQTNTSATKDILEKASPVASGVKNVNGTSAAGAESKDPAQKKDKKEDDSVLKHSKVNQALSKGPVVEMRPMANALAAIGLDLVREHVYKDLVKLQGKKKSQKKLSKREEEQLDRLKDAHDVVVKKNETFAGHKVLKCHKCPYSTVSKNQFELHKEHAHQTKFGSYECPICEFETKQRNAIAFHMEAEHNRKCRWLTIPWGFYVCPLCPFENNSYSAYNKHIIKCQKQFKLRRNLEPVPGDCDIPIKPLLKPKPLPKPLQPAKKLSEKNVSSLLAKARGPVSAGARLNVGLPGNIGQMKINTPFLPAQLNRVQGTAIQPQAGQPQQLVQVQGQWYTLFYVNGQAYLSPVGSNPVLGTATPAVLAKPVLAQPLPGMVAQQLIQPRSAIQLKQQQVTVHGSAHARLIAPRQAVHTNIKQKLASEASIQEKVLSCVAGSPQDKSFEICEICGGFVKDSDSLRIHFYWAHKIDIPKHVFGTRKPHLVCGRINNSARGSCTERYWTYQGLHRHREIVHGEGEAPTSRLKIYSCFMCGENNVVSLIGHMRAKHSLAVGSWLRNFKCVCCGLILKTRTSLENHLLALHGDVFITKGLIDQLATFDPPKAVPAKGNPVPTGMFENTAKLPKSPEKKVPKLLFPCAHCDLKFGEQKAVEAHSQSAHSYKCNRCPQRFSSKVFMEKHYMSHRIDKDVCPLCQEKVLIGRPFVRHMKREHMKGCSVIVKKMPQSQYNFYLDRWKERAAELPVPVKNKVEKKACESVIILDSDDDHEPASPSSKRVSDHSTEDEPPAKKAKTEKNDTDTVTVVELTADGKPSGIVDEIETSPEKVDTVEKSVNDPEELSKTQEEVGESEKSPKNISKRDVEILEVDGETIIVQKEDD